MKIQILIPIVLGAIALLHFLLAVPVSSIAEIHIPDSCVMLVSSIISPLIALLSVALCIKEDSDFEENVETSDESLLGVDAAGTPKDQMAAMNTSHMEFLSYVMHELKSPLASCLMNAQSLAGGYLGSLNENQERAARMVVNNLKLFQVRLKKFTELAHIERGTLQAHKRPCLIGKEVIRPLLRELDGQIKRWKIKVNQQIPDDLAIHADPDLMNAVFQNLLSNAINYGEPNGTIRISSEIQESAIKLSVYNTGPGIKPEHLPNLFQEFFRGDLPRLTNEQGSGLGLYIARQIIRVHGGSIQADSVENEWSEFTILLPHSSGTPTDKESV